MIKKLIAVIGCGALLLAGCGVEKSESKIQSGERTESVQQEEILEQSDVTAAAPLEDGVYTVDFKSDSSMFHVNEAYDGTATLTVKDGEMTAHLTLVSKSIVNLFPGMAKDAKKQGAKLIEPTLDTVTYEDGMTEEVYGFDVPVPMIGDTFDLALLGSKGKWYDHKVSLSDPRPVE